MGQNRSMLLRGILCIDRTISSLNLKFKEYNKSVNIHLKDNETYGIISVKRGECLFHIELQYNEDKIHVDYSVSEFVFPETATKEDRNNSIGCKDLMTINMGIVNTFGKAIDMIDKRILENDIGV